MVAMHEAEETLSRCALVARLERAVTDDHPEGYLHMHVCFTAGYNPDAAESERNRPEVVGRETFRLLFPMANFIYRPRGREEWPQRPAVCGGHFKK